MLGLLIHGRVRGNSLCFQFIPGGGHGYGGTLPAQLPAFGAANLPAYGAANLPAYGAYRFPYRT